MRGQHIYRDRQVKYDQKTYYGVTNKAKYLLEEDSKVKKSQRESLEFAKECQETFGDLPFTRTDAFHKFSRPYGLTYYQVVDFIRDAQENSFLECTRIDK